MSYKLPELYCCTSYGTTISTRGNLIVATELIEYLDWATDDDELFEERILLLANYLQDNIIY